MSSNNASPAGEGDGPVVETLRREAKRLLKQVRAGDTVLIGIVRELLPRLAGMSDVDVASSIKLADVQHAIARKRGMPSWRALTAQLAAVDPIQVHAARFLLALREHAIPRAFEILRKHPDLAYHSIHTAAAVGNADAVARFIAADPTSATRGSEPGGVEPILYAAHAGLQRLVHDQDRGTDATWTSDGLRTVTLLLDAGTSANAFVTIDGEQQARIPALYFACVSNNVPVVRLLLSRGAQPNDGESVYHSAEHNHRECLELLVAHGGDVGSRHAHWDNTPLYFLAGHAPTSALHESAVLGMQWLLEHGADPNIPSAVHARPDGTPGIAETPLHRIAANGAGVHVAQMLVQHGAMVDAERSDGRTPFALAMRAGNREVADYLVSVGADATKMSDSDRLIAACAVADKATARAIVELNPQLIAKLNAEDGFALSSAAQRGETESVRLMLALGWPVDREGPWGGTPLHQAAWFGRADAARLLLDAGAPIDLRDRAFGSSPIAWAAHGSVNSRPGHDEEYLAVVNLLLDAGAARATSYNSWNEPPESLGSPAVARLLRHRGFAP